MNNTQIADVLKIALSFAGGIAVSKGWLNTADVSTLTTDILAAVGPVAALVAGAYGVWANSEAKLAANVAANPNVSKVETTPKLAAAMINANPAVVPFVTVKDAK